MRSAVCALIWCALVLVNAPVSNRQSVPESTLDLQLAKHWLSQNKAKLDKPEEQLAVGRAIARASLAAKLDPAQVLYVGWRESRWTWHAKNYNGPHLGTDYGPMQVNDRWTPEIRRQTPQQRLQTGVDILKRYHLRCRYDWRCTHRAYRTGQVTR